MDAEVVKRVHGESRCGIVQIPGVRRPKRQDLQFWPSQRHGFHVLVTEIEGKIVPTRTMENIQVRKFCASMQGQ
jgi:hypothetical protein